MRLFRSDDGMRSPLRRFLLAHREELGVRIGAVLREQNPLALDLDLHREAYVPVAQGIIVRLFTCGSPEQALAVVYEALRREFGELQVAAQPELPSLGREIWHIWNGGG